MLTRAYRNLFDGRATKQEAQMVLADLASHSGFYQVLPPGGGGERAGGSQRQAGRLRAAFSFPSPERGRAARP